MLRREGRGAVDAIRRDGGRDDGGLGLVGWRRVELIEYETVAHQEDKADKKADAAGAIHNSKVGNLARNSAGRRHRIIPLAAPGMAPHDAGARPTPRPRQMPWGADGLLHVVGAGRHVATATLEAKHDLHGRKDNAINANEKDGNRLHERISMAKFPKKAMVVRRRDSAVSCIGAEARLFLNSVIPRGGAKSGMSVCQRGAYSERSRRTWLKFSTTPRGGFRLFTKERIRRFRGHELSRSFHGFRV